MVALFFIGIVEMFIVTSWTKVVSESRILASGVITMVNVLTWYYVLERILNDLGNWQLVTAYAVGCSFGTVLSTWYFQSKERSASLRLEAMPAK